ncbi:hypothetical protein PhCBS80983_g02966 [Powellomyces hirtus]|uniref:PRELI/MSF1 domain-containing protein n=1 Tax=Powellomyces hirtus TaxID=109895 RepID=A0A507E5L6_9FUNG|nr:PRELI-like family-domain-containing protein [Powellomyces hirtus]TPX58687.1 hypothetical protein PhCBS80983_g02966 [Powellomyces hirtus]
MKFTENQYLFAHPFGTITEANWRKYPNEYSSHVLSVDILSREVCPTTGVLRSERLVSVKQSAPALLRRLLPIPEVTYFREVSFLDPKRKSYKAISNNLSMRSIVDVEETCEFNAADPQSPDSGGTVFKQRAEVNALGALSYAARLVEETAVSSFKANSWKGRQGLETVVDKILMEAEGLEAGFKELEAEFKNLEADFKEGIEAGIEGMRRGSVGL